MESRTLPCCFAQWTSISERRDGRGLGVDRATDSPAKRGGRRRGVDVREVLNAIFYVLSTGCQWKALPKDLPPKSTAHFNFECCGTGRHSWSAFTTRSMSRRANAKDAMRPTAAIIDSQSAKAAQKGRKPRSAGIRCSQEGRGPQRHILVDTPGLLLSVVVYPADIQDRDGAALVLNKRTRRLFPFIERIYADRILGTTRPCRRRTNRHLEDRDHQTIPYRQRLRGPAKKMGGRENVGLIPAATVGSHASATPEPSPRSSVLL